MTDTEAAEARIAAALARLGADHEPPVGWEARVLAAVAAPGRRWWFAAPIAGIAAAAFALWALWPGGALALEVALDGGPRVRSGPTGDGSAGHVGQIVRATASGGGRYRAVRIYLRGQLIAACPAAPACSGPDRADLALTAVGRYLILALAADAPLPAPAGAFDVDVSTAQAAGVRWTWSELAVR